MLRPSVVMTPGIRRFGRFYSHRWCFLACFRLDRMSLFPGFRCQTVNARMLLPLIADFPGVYSITANQLDSPWRQRGNQLVHELKDPESLYLAFIVLPGGCFPNSHIGSRIVLDFLGTGGTANHTLSTCLQTRSLPVSFTEKPGLSASWFSFILQ